MKDGIFSKHGLNKVNDSKMLWKTVKSRFSNKWKTASNYFDRRGYNYEK